MPSCTTNTAQIQLQAGNGLRGFAIPSVIAGKQKRGDLLLLYLILFKTISDIQKLKNFILLFSQKAQQQKLQEFTCRVVDISTNTGININIYINISTNYSKKYEPFNNVEYDKIWK